MAMADEVPMLETDAEHGGVSRSQHSRPRRWMVVGMVTVVAGVAGVLYSYTRVRANAVHFQLARGHHIMKAFAIRALQDDNEYTGEVHWTWKEKGADDPEKMTIVGSLTKNDDTTPDAKITFKAKEGKADDLKKQLEAILEEKQHLIAEMYGEDAGSAFGESVSVEDPDDDKVTINVADPAPEDFSDMDDEMKSSPPKLDLNIAFGRDLGEMTEEHLDDSLLTVMGGFKFSGQLSIASAFFDELISDGEVPPEVAMQLEFAKEVASETTDMETLYKPGAKFASIPSWGDILGSLSYHASTLHEEMIEKLNGLNDFADGLTDIKVGGLPGKYEIDFDLTNCHVAPLIKYILHNIPEKETSYWN